MDNVRRLLNYNVYFASLYTFLRVRYQSSTRSPQLKKLLTFSGAVVPALGLKLNAWSPFSKKKSEAEIYGVRVQNRNDVTVLKDILAADKLYEEGVLNVEKYADKNEQIYELLLKHKDKKEPEVLWRLARITYERAKEMKAQERNEALQEAFSLVRTSLELDEENFAAHKWMAILLNEISVMKSLKEQILQSETVKKHMLRASELNPNDPTSIYLLGAWCFSVAEVPWYQRKAAETFIAKPPTCEFREALKHFIKAENARPFFYSMNLLMLAKTYLKLEDYNNAYKYLWLLTKKYKVRSAEDISAKEEGISLLRTYRSYFTEATENGNTEEVMYKTEENRETA